MSFLTWVSRVVFVCVAAEVGSSYSSSSRLSRWVALLLVRRRWVAGSGEGEGSSEGSGA